MPIYEYECQECGNVFEIKQGFNDIPLTDCKFCKGEVRKVFHAPGIHFKGTGWYVTDYPSADRKKHMQKEKKISKDAPAPAKS